MSSIKTIPGPAMLFEPEKKVRDESFELLPGEETVRTSFRVSKRVKHAVSVRVVADGYGMRGKSRWITVAINEFLNPSVWQKFQVSASEGAAPWKRIIIDNEMIMKDASTIPEAVHIEKELWVRLWRAALDAVIYGSELDAPVYLELSVASVIRAAIMWKLEEPLQ